MSSQKPNCRRAAQLALSAGIFTAAITFAQQAKSDHMKAVLSQMDASSAKFQSAQADLKQELFTKIVQDTETQSGSVYFMRSGNSPQMGLKLGPPGAGANAAPAQFVEFKSGKLRVYNVGTNHVDEFSSSGKNQSLAETFMTLGFGGSGTDLDKAWNITDQGTEQMNDGSKSVTVEKLDLVSHDEGVKKNFSHITIWIDAARDVSLKQEFFATTGDTRTVFYTNLRLNQKVNTDPFAIKCKGKCS